MKSETFAYRCEKESCTYVAHGSTKRQAMQRMADHWTARDHEQLVRDILANTEETAV